MVDLNKSLRVPPHNIEAERALLGAVILKPETIHDVSAIVYPESFYADKHREIFRAIFEIFAAWRTQKSPCVPRRALFVEPLPPSGSCLLGASTFASVLHSHPRTD